MIPGVGVVLESRHPQQLGRCCSELLGCPVADNEDASTSVVKVGDGMALQFVRAAAVKEEKSRLHLDLSSMSKEHHASLVERACDLGCRRVDIHQGLATTSPTTRGSRTVSYYETRTVSEESPEC
ncbi:VOC family protein [Mycolicibacterium poriferae]|uniref:VOC family protein n=1 Tax=Mycolicibacterium poriferae TaxID=39694 RepID=UPI0024BAF94B|nr:VOC family protein [Mycolicibacterium poriferae]